MGRAVNLRIDDHILAGAVSGPKGMWNHLCGSADHRSQIPQLPRTVIEILKCIEASTQKTLNMLADDSAARLVVNGVCLRPRTAAEVVGSPS